MQDESPLKCFIKVYGKQRKHLRKIAFQDRPKRGQLRLDISETVIDRCVALARRILRSLKLSLHPISRFSVIQISTDLLNILFYS